MQMRPALAVLLLAFALLAGCSGKSHSATPSPTGSNAASGPALKFESDILIDDKKGASEPSILVDPSGTIWVVGPTGLVTPASEGDVAAYTHDSGVWSSTDGGKTWKDNLPIPMYGRDACPGGGDSDITASPDGTLYLIDLWLGNVPIDVSRDHGATWTFNCYTSVLPGDDRQWVAADDQSVWISVNNLAAGAEVYRSDRVEGSPANGLVFGPPTLVDTGGDLVVDPATGTLLLAGTGETVYVSTDRGATFQPHETGLKGRDLDGGFVTVAFDQVGHMFVGGNGKDGFLVSGSTDGGKTWTKAAALKPYAKGEYAFPWITAGGDGVVDVAWYGKPDPAPAGGKGYYVFAGQTGDLLSKGANATWSWTQVTEKPVLTIDICMGLGCGPGRALGDFFEVGTDLTGHAVLAYDDANGHEPPQLKFAHQIDGLLAPPRTATPA